MGRTCRWDSGSPARGLAARQHSCFRRPSRRHVRLLRMLRRSDRAYAHAHCDARLCRARAHRAGFRNPNGFLPIAGGTLNYAGFDQWTFGPLPIDGTNALVSQRIHHDKIRNEFQRQRHHVDACRTDPELPGTVVERRPEPAGESISRTPGTRCSRPGTPTTRAARHGGCRCWPIAPPGLRSPAPINVDNGPPFNNFVGAGGPTMVGNGTLTFADANNGSFSYTRQWRPRRSPRRLRATTLAPARNRPAPMPRHAQLRRGNQLSGSMVGGQRGRVGRGVNFSIRATVFCDLVHLQCSTTRRFGCRRCFTRQGMGNVYTGPIYRFGTALRRLRPHQGDGIPWAPPRSPSPTATMRHSGTR